MNVKQLTITLNIDFDLLRKQSDTVYELIREKPDCINVERRDCLHGVLNLIDSIIDESEVLNDE